MRRAPLALLALAVPALAQGCATDRLAMQFDVGAVAVPASVPLTVSADCDSPPCGDVFDAGGSARDGVAGRASWGAGLDWLEALRILPRLHLDLGVDFQYAHLALAAVDSFPVPGTPGASYSAPGTGADLFYMGAPLQLRWTFAPAWDLSASAVPGVVEVMKQVDASTGASSTMDDGAPDVLGRLGVERGFDFDRYGVGLYAQLDPLGLFDGAFLTFDYHFGEESYRELP